MKNKKIYERFLKFYDLHVDEIFRYCLYKLSNRENAEDLTQESFIRLWRNISDGKQIENKRAYIFRIAGNLVIDFYRKNKSFSLDQLTEKGFDIGHSEKEDIENRIDSFSEIIKLRKINEEYAEAVFLRYVSCLGVKEISDIMKKSESNVSVCIHRGIKKLRDIATKDRV